MSWRTEWPFQVREMNGRFVVVDTRDEYEVMLTAYLEKRDAERDARARSLMPGRNP